MLTKQQKNTILRSITKEQLVIQYDMIFREVKSLIMKNDYDNAVKTLTGVCLHIIDYSKATIKTPDLGVKQ